MPKTLFHALIVLGLANIGCGNQSKDKKDKVAAQNDSLAAVQAVKDSPILGTWKLCTPMLPPEDGEVEAPLPSIKSVLRSMAFDEQGKGYRGLSFHKDSDCKMDFGQADIQTYLLELELWFKSQGVPELPAEVVEQVSEQYSAKQDLFRYRLETVNALAGNLDITDEKSGKTAYTTYQVTGNMLQAADTCDQETVASGDDPDCTEVIGDSPSNRATEFDILLYK